VAGKGRLKRRRWRVGYGGLLRAQRLHSQWIVGARGQGEMTSCVCGFNAEAAEAACVWTTKSPHIHATHASGIELFIEAVDP
jgi:hypothetical protein